MLIIVTIKNLKIKLYFVNRACIPEYFSRRACTCVYIINVHVHANGPVEAHFNACKLIIQLPLPVVYQHLTIVYANNVYNILIYSGNPPFYDVIPATSLVVSYFDRLLQ
jgi:hypothetical protein